MKNPVPASQLANQDYMKCELPNTGKEICNGLENITIAADTGVVSSPLLNSCNFNSTNWATCFNCPSTAPTLDNPTPPSAVQSTAPNYRHPVPDNCDSIWWDPGKPCLYLFLLPLTLPPPSCGPMSLHDL